MRIQWVLLIAIFCAHCQSPNSSDQEGVRDEQSDQIDREEYTEDHSFQELVRKYESEDRIQWQKPEKVIEMMGDLSGKTIADIGAGTGYFTFRLLPIADTVVAIDIDPRMISFIDSSKQSLSEEYRSRLFTRLAEPMDPKLKKGEADIAFLANTYIYIEDRVKYFSDLKENISKGGALMILDYKKKQLPIGPPQSIKVSLSQVEQELQEAGYEHIYTDDQTLPYQYIVIALKNDRSFPTGDTASMR